jgi:hypothetical protein
MVIGSSWMSNIIYLSNRDVWKIFSITSANNRKGIKPFKFEDVGLKFVDEVNEFVGDNLNIQEPYNADAVVEKKRRFEVIDKKEFIFFAIKHGINYN